jgi:hypothetical protein
MGHLWTGEHACRLNGVSDRSRLCIFYHFNFLPGSQDPYQVADSGNFGSDPLHLCPQQQAGKRQPNANH